MRKYVKKVIKFGLIVMVLALIAGLFILFKMKQIETDAIARKNFEDQKTRIYATTKRYLETTNAFNAEILEANQQYRALLEAYMEAFSFLELTNRLLDMSYEKQSQYEKAQQELKEAVTLDKMELTDDFSASLKRKFSQETAKIQHALDVVQNIDKMALIQKLIAIREGKIISPNVDGAMPELPKELMDYMPSPSVSLPAKKPEGWFERFKKIFIPDFSGEDLDNPEVMSQES